MPVVKICGLRSLEDAEKAVELGAEYLGFIFAESPRKIDQADARQIRKRIGSTAKIVGVFKDQDSQYINDLADALRLDFVQLHGAETPEYCAQISHPIIKAIELDGNEQDLSNYYVHAFLFDRPKSKSDDTQWLERVVNNHREYLERWRPFFIAGGLSSDNLNIALRLTPYGIDTASGVESSPGVKDHAKLKSFISTARGKEDA